MSRPSHLWISFALCLAVVLAAMGWVSWMAVELDSAEQRARVEVELNEKVRLALWRMEAALLPLLARETGRPYFAYRSFYPAERAYTSMFAEIVQGEVMVPSPLIDLDSPYIRLHFQYGPDGSLTSPQVPSGNPLDVVETDYVPHRRIEECRRVMTELGGVLDVESLRSALGLTSSLTRAVPVSDVQSKSFQQSEVSQQQVFRNLNEWNVRVTIRTKDEMTPVWVNSELFLVRSVMVLEREYLQGCWLDWLSVRTWLLGLIQDLLPEATLRMAGELDTSEGRTIAALPIRLDPGCIASLPPLHLTPIRFSLGLAWACVLLAAIAVASLLRGTISLSERRFAFASSVTHELRTPLTTFQMYTEMLDEEMVSPEKRHDYLMTLRKEADRLGHLVENVLTYAQLERSPSGRSLTSLAIGQLLESVEERMAQRATQAGFNLKSSVSGIEPDVEIRTDPAAVEQILFNLVDNACKYAAPLDDRRLHFEVSRSGNRLHLRVRDHGPGINQREAGRLFRPFCKSKEAESMHTPGVGLGLALSRQLARTMKGDLKIDRSVADGAAFELILPLSG